MDATIAFTSTNCLNVKILKLNKVSLQAPVDLNAIKDQINLMIYHFYNWLWFFFKFKLLLKQEHNN